MLRNKADVDRHVQGLLRKVKSDSERNLRCFNIAQLYYKVQDYESAHHYVKMYLSVRCDSPSAHKLLGQTLESMGYKEKALSAYKKSLELEANQAELVLKMCQLLCDREVTFDPSKAQYWAERASSLFPHSPAVFMLKEKLLATDSAKNFEDFENLFKSELKARPTDTVVRVKLLNLYLDNDRIDIAYNSAFEIEFKPEPSHQISWYHCLNNVCDAFQKVYPVECNWEFYLRWLSALDRLCSLCLSETLIQPSSLVESTEVVYNFDQVLYKGSQQQSKAPEFYRELIKHFSAQLTFHIAVLLLKRAKKENSLWKEIKRLVCPLLLFASNGELISEGISTFSVKDNYQKLVKLSSHHAQCRIVQAGHVLCSLAKESQTEKLFFSKVGTFAYNDWRNEIFQKTFKSHENGCPGTSYLVMSSYYNETPQKNVSCLNLKPSFFVPSFELTYMGSLHHLVWLGLQSLTNPASPVSCKLLPCFHTTFFKSLLFTVNNLNNVGVETLNQLDVDSFLYSAVFCAGAIIEDQKTNGYYVADCLDILPPDIMPLLCTPDQAKWWTNACSINKVGVPILGFKNKIYDIRHHIQRGIEVVRGGGLQLELLVSLARAFAMRAGDGECEDEKNKSCEARALHLWQIAIPQLERLHDKQPITDNALKLFEYPTKELSPSDVNNLLEEGRFFIACHYMKLDQHEKAIDAFKILHTPQSVFNQALIYQKLAKDHLSSLRGEEITSEFRSRRIVLATRARDCLYALRDMIKSDRNHPLHQKLKCKLVEIDDLLSRIEPESDAIDRDGGMSDTSLSFGSAGSPTGDASNHVHYSRGKHVLSSTPKKYYDMRHRSNTADIAELLSVHLSTSQLKTHQVILEQNRLVLERIESLKLEQRSQRLLIDDLVNKFNKLEVDVKGSLTDIKKEIKRPDLYNMLEDDDYNDDMLHYPNIPFYPQRGVQGANTVTYGAPVTPFFSPRVDSVYQNNMGFYNQGTLPFPDSQQVSDFLRTMPPSQSNHSLTQKINTPTQNMPNSLTLGGQSNVNQSSPATSLQTYNLQKLPSQVTPSSLGSHVRAHQGPTNVVITTSDTLPTGTPPSQPTLSVTIPPQHRLGSAAPHNFQIAMPTNAKIVEKSPVGQEDLESDDEIIEQDPFPNYQPIIPLPNKVDVKTGEENEQMLFSCRAKLFRFIDKQWKERGIGMLKILKDDSSGKCRILMRREQVHKVCANHFITGDMYLEPMMSSDRAWVWFANDFADEKVQLEKLCAKFKTIEDGNNFKAAFDKCKLSVKELSQHSSPNVSGNFTALSNSPVEIKSKDPEPIEPNRGHSGAGVGFGISSFNFNVAHKVNSQAFGNDNKTQQLSEGFEQVSNSSVGGTLSLERLTFLKPPKLILDEKKDSKVDKEKKTESPFANFSFTSTKPVESSKEVLKPMSPKSILKEPLNKAPEPQKHVMFLPGIDFGSFTNQDGSGSKVDTLPKTFEGFSTPVFNPTIQNSPLNVSSPDDEFTPTAEFKPVVPLPQLVDVKSGEEGEILLYEGRAKLFRYCQDSKQWRERGIGNMKILKDPDNGIVRLLMRREQVFKVCCNHRLTKDTVLKPFSGDKAFLWAAVQDFSEEVPKDELFSLKFGTAEQALSFKNAFENAQANLSSTDKENNSKEVTHLTCKSQTASDKVEVKDDKLAEESSKVSLATLLKPKEGSWECEDCFVRNNANVLKCAACGKSKPGVKQDNLILGNMVVKNNGNTSSLIPNSLGTFSFGNGSFNFGLNKESPKFVTGNTKPANLEAPTADLDVKKPDANSNAPATGFVFGASSYQSGGRFAFGSPHFQFSMPQINNSLTKSPNNTCEPGSDNDESEDDNGDEITFQPVVPLPDEVAIITGEEEEDVFYTHRAKLLRYDTKLKVWKDRGVGDFKILKHRENGKIRFLMRRDFVKKLCINHYLTRDIEIRPQGAKAWIWHAADYADGNVKQEYFALRFKTPDIAKEFKLAVDKALAEYLGSNTNTNIFSEATTKYDPGESIESGVISTKDSVEKEEELEIVFENQMPSEDREKALELMLPPNFYSYRLKPPCPGCRGCERDDENTIAMNIPANKDDAVKTVQLTNENTRIESTSSSRLNTPIFGGSATVSNSLTGFTFGQHSLPMQGTNIFAGTVSDTGLKSFFSNEMASFSNVVNSKKIFACDPNFKWEGAHSTIFGSKISSQNVEKPCVDNDDDKEDAEVGHNESNEEVPEGHDISFTPVVPLPEKIELKTGEEEEIKVFCERAKLFRRDEKSKEWKERGVGEMKLLKHTMKGTYRLLMRREQVHKVVCNHLISSSFDLKVMSTSDQSWCWYAMNLAQEYENPQLEFLAARFKNVEIAQSFKSAIECALCDIHQNLGDESQASFHSADLTADEEEIKTQND